MDGRYRDVAKDRDEREHQCPHQRQDLIRAAKRRLLPSCRGAYAGAYCWVKGPNASEPSAIAASTPPDNVVA